VISGILAVIVVEADAAYHSVLVRWLKEARDIRVAGSFRNAEAALAFVTEHTGDLLLINPALPGLRGPACIRRALEKTPTLRVVVLADLTDEETVHEYIDAGAHGCLESHSVSAVELHQALRDAFNGHHPLSRRAATIAWRICLSRSSASKRPPILTHREHEVALLLAQGHTNRSIAGKLGIALYTVYTHVQNILKRTGTHNRQEAIARLYRKSGPLATGGAPGSDQNA
jgi:two-component system, NarL family, response regulator LiaR